MLRAADLYADFMPSQACTPAPTPSLPSSWNSRIELATYRAISTSPNSSKNSKLCQFLVNSSKEIADLAVHFYKQLCWKWYPE